MSQTPEITRDQFLRYSALTAVGLFFTSVSTKVLAVEQLTILDRMSVAQNTLPNGSIPTGWNDAALGIQTYQAVSIAGVSVAQPVLAHLLTQQGNPIYSFNAQYSPAGSPQQGIGRPASVDGALTRTQLLTIDPSVRAGVKLGYTDPNTGVITPSSNTLDIRQFTQRVDAEQNGNVVELQAPKLDLVERKVLGPISSSTPNPTIGNSLEGTYSPVQAAFSAGVTQFNINELTNGNQRANNLEEPNLVVSGGRYSLGYSGALRSQGLQVVATHNNLPETYVAASGATTVSNPNSSAFARWYSATTLVPNVGNPVLPYSYTPFVIDGNNSIQINSGGIAFNISELTAANPNITFRGITFINRAYDLGNRTNFSSLVGEGVTLAINSAQMFTAYQSELTTVLRAGKGYVGYVVSGIVNGTETRVVGAHYAQNMQYSNSPKDSGQRFKIHLPFTPKSK